MQCRLCGSGELILYYTQGNNNQYKFYKCRNCKLVNYDLSDGLDQGKYTLSYTDPLIKNHKINIDQIETYNFIKKNIKAKGKMLDIGCGNGRLLLSAKEDGWDVKGIELSEKFGREIKERFNIEVEIINFFDYRNQLSKYDVIVIRHVLEHLPEPISAMNKINENLIIGGFGILEFPNIESLNLKLKRFMSKIGLLKKSYLNEYVPGHCNEYSKSSFNYLAEKTGFKLLKWELYSSTHRFSKLLTLFNISAKARVLIQKTSESI